MAKKKDIKTKKETIKVTNSYLDRFTLDQQKRPIDPDVRKAFELPYSPRTSYYLARVFDKLVREMKIYTKEKQKCVEKFAKKHESDGEEKDKNGKVIRKWKKGDVVSDGQSVSLEDPDGFVKEINELSEAEIDIGIEKVLFDLDKEPKGGETISPNVMKVLLPLIKIKE